MTADPKDPDSTDTEDQTFVDEYDEAYLQEQRELELKWINRDIEAGEE